MSGGPLLEKREKWRTPDHILLRRQQIYFVRPPSTFSLSAAAACAAASLAVSTRNGEHET